jgi:hypothetical protein
MTLTPLVLCLTLLAAAPSRPAQPPTFEEVRAKVAKILERTLQPAVGHMRCALGKLTDDELVALAGEVLKGSTKKPKAQVLYFTAPTQAALARVCARLVDA